MTLADASPRSDGSASRDSGPGPRDVVSFLADPASYRPPADAVEHFETHSAHVFLAGDFAYKIKKPVKFPFLDFSTLELRRRACLNELRVNARQAPDLYLGVEPITHAQATGLQIGGKGKAVEWTVKMRRFDQTALYDQKARTGRLQVSDMRALADAILACHDHAKRVISQQVGTVPLEHLIGENAQAMAAAPAIYPPDAAQRFTDRCLAHLDDNRELLVERALRGHVRRCHGDLHLRNIVELDGGPVLFDAIEFSEEVATVDVLDDLAFLLMDLWVHDLKEHANALLNDYVFEQQHSEVLEGLGLLPLFLATRAMIRSKAELFRIQNTADADRRSGEANARRLFQSALSFLETQPPMLVAIGGVSGSGKSTMARSVAPTIGAVPGAVVLRSDLERKRLFGVSELTRLSEEAYRPSVTNQVFATLRKRAAMALSAGHSVVVDAVHISEAQRDKVEQVARDAGAPFAGIWLTAPASVLVSRVRQRRNDASDATPKQVDDQLAWQSGTLDWAIIDSSRPVAQVRGDVLDAIERARAAAGTAS